MPEIIRPTPKNWTIKKAKEITTLNKAVIIPNAPYHMKNHEKMMAMQVRRQKFRLTPPLLAIKMDVAIDAYRYASTLYASTLPATGGSTGFVCGTMGNERFRDTESLDKRLPCWPVDAKDGLVFFDILLPLVTKRPRIGRNCMRSAMVPLKWMGYVPSKGRELSSTRTLAFPSRIKKLM
jgi:hypothetical protein